LCISCGACAHICPRHNIEVRFNRYRGKWEPKLFDIIKCQRCNGGETCLSVCPSYNVDYIELAESNSNQLLGKIQNVYTGFSKNHYMRYHSSSGGFIREACLTLLEDCNLDGIIALTHDQGLEYTPKLIKNVGLMPNSIYHNVSFQNALSLLKNIEGKFALIGLPCQITSIELFTRKKKYSYIKDRIRMKISLICGYSFDRKNIQAFAHYNGFDLKEVIYRERGRYRKTRLKNGKDELVYEVYKPKNLREKINNSLFFDRFLANPGCLYCVDHIGYCADMVVGDAWLERYADDDIGTNIIVCRTARSEELIARMKSFQFNRGSKDDVIYSQSSLYALGSLGEGMIRMKLSNNYFVPQKKRTDLPSELTIYNLTFKDLVKVKLIKELLRSEKFNLARYLYIILHHGMVLNHVRKNWYYHS